MNKKFCIFLLGRILPLFPSTFSFANCMEITPYGFVKLDVLYEDKIIGSLPEIPPDEVPLSNDHADQHSQTVIDARNSRIGIQGISEAFGINMRGVIEGDFFNTEGDAVVFNSRVFRLRLAYAVADLPSGLSLLIGQYWSLLTNIPNVSPPLMLTVNSEFTPVGVPLSRQPQIRLGYKKIFPEIGDFILEASAEKHAFNQVGFITPTSGEVSQGSEQRWPLLTGKVTWLTDQFKWSVAMAMAQSIVITNKSGKEVDHEVWAVHSSASYTWRSLTFWATVHHSVGLNRLFFDFVPDVELYHNHLLPFSAYGGTVALQWNHIKDTLWYNVLFGWEHALKNSNIDIKNAVYKTFQDFRINVFYQFWEHWLVGLEYQKILVKAFNGKTGNVNAIHLGVWYFFGESPP